MVSRTLVYKLNYKRSFTMSELVCIGEIMNTPDSNNKLPESISALRSLLFDYGSLDLEAQLRMFVSAVRNGTGEKLPKSYYTDILNEIIQTETAKAALDARIDELTYIRAFSGQPYAMSDINDRPLTIKDRIKELSDALKQGPANAK